MVAAVQEAVGGDDFTVEVVSVYGRHEAPEPDHMPRPPSRAHTRPPLHAHTLSQHQPTPTIPLEPRFPDDQLQHPRPPDTEPEVSEPRRTPPHARYESHEPHTPQLPQKTREPQPLRHPTVNRTSLEEPTSPPENMYSLIVSPPTLLTPTADAAHLTPSTCVWVSVRNTATRFMDPVKLRGLLALHTTQVCSFIAVLQSYIQFTLWVQHCDTIFFIKACHLDCCISIFYSIINYSSDCSRIFTDVFIVFVILLLV